MRTLALAPLAASLLLLAACAKDPAGTAIAGAAAAESAAPAPLDDAALVERGEYLVTIGGCNDCHTPGYPESGGTTPKTGWLVGTGIGWHGPWGTTYPANLRLRLQEMDEAGWMKFSAELHTRPPMPDFAVRAMREEDRRAIYRFIRSLGPAGKPAPGYLPPGQQPQAPYVDWVLPPPAEAPAAG